MEARYAIIKDGFVDNIVVIDPENTEFILANNAIELPPDSPVSIGWSYTNMVFTAAERIVDVEVAKDRKRNVIRGMFEIASSANVVHNGITWQGGYERALRLDAARRLAELAGQSTVTLYDLNNIGHAMTIAEASSLVLVVSSAYQVEFARKQARMVAIDQATTVAEVQAITY